MQVKEQIDDKEEIAGEGETRNKEKERNETKKKWKDSSIESTGEEMKGGLESWLANS